jgi:alpha-L-fucosidase
MGHPSPLEDSSGAGYGSGDANAHKGYLVAEFTYPILPGHQGGAQWFYSLPKHDGLCLSAEKLYKDYLGAVKYGNIFSIDVGPDYEGKLRAIDVETLRKVGEMIKKGPPPASPTALSEGKPAKASSVWGGGLEAGKAFDGDDESRWGAEKDARNGWLEVDLGKDTEVGCAMVKELACHRTESFVIEYKEGDNWKELVKGSTIAGEKAFKFKPVTARIFRLNITKANEVPTIEEFQLFAPGTTVW